MSRSVHTTEASRRDRVRARRDLAFIGLGSVLVYAAASYLDAFERVAALVAALDSWQGDEVIVVAVVLAFALVVFSARRCRELSREMRRREAAEAELFESKSELERRVRVRTAELSESNTRLEHELGERRAAEEALRRSEEQYRQFVEHATDIIYRTDPEGRFTYCNPVASRIMKYEEAELVGRHFLSLVRPDWRERVGEFYAWQSAGRIGSTYYEFPAVAQDGSEVWVEQNVQMLLDGDELVGFQSVARDLTERRRAEEARREAEEYHNLFRHANDAIIIFEPEGEVVLDVNDRACEVYGRAREEFVGRSLKEFSREVERGEAEIRKLLERGSYQEFETVQFRGDGTPIDLLINASLIDFHGRPAVLSINRDITERNQMEDALRRSEEQYRGLVENAKDMIVTFDLAGRFTSANRASLDLTGYTLEEALQLNLWQVVAPESVETAREMLASKLSGTRESTFYELTLLAKDGARIYLEVSSWVFYRDGVPVVAQAIGRDITERKQMEAALHRSEESLRQSQKMEAIGTLAGGVAHDFNNLLTAIIGYSELTLMRLGPGDPLRGNVEEIRKAAERSATLTRQLLAFSRRQRLERKALCTNELLGDLMKMLRRIIGEDVEVRLHAAPNLPAVFADPGQVEQVVLNLAVNARDAMPGGGRLDIETRAVELDETYCRQHPDAQPGRYVQLSVSDNGTGMDAATRARVFEPFFTTKAAGSGTGLGLATVYGIVNQHGGSIEVYSEPGQGTTFKVNLPVADCAAAHSDGRSATAPRGGGEMILLAEDEPALRDMGRDVLEGLGYVVKVAGNGEEALALFGEHRDEIDLVMLDMVMPRMGGLEAYERLRLLSPDVPVIFMTGYSVEMLQDRSAGRSTRFDQANAVVIQKPYSLETFGRKVREVLGSAAVSG